MSIENNKMILLVEDDAFTALNEKKTLEKFGYKVVIANNGEEAVNAVEKIPGIDLILMDINLGGGMDGTEVAAIILGKRDIPVVFLSAHTEPEIVEKTEKITSYGYVVKASSNTVLDASIKMAFKLFEAKIKEKKKEQALRESEASYRVLFLGASDGILLADSETKKFSFANPSICRMFGYTEEEFLQMSVADIHPQEFQEYILAEFAALARKEIRSSIEIPCLRKDGTVFYADISHSTMTLEGREYQAGFFHDITERKQSKETLRESETRYRELFDNISSGVAIYEVRGDGKDFIFRDLNRAGERLDKTRKEDVIGKSIYQVRPGIEKFGLVEVFKRVFATGIPEHYPSKLYRDEKLQGWYDNFVYRLPSGEMVAVYDDVSGSKQAEVEIKRQLAEKEILLKEVHHRIKNNIASIGSLISLHMQSVANSEANEVLKDAIGRINSMRVLYNKLLLNEDYKDISVKNYLDDLVETIIAIFPDNAKITIDKRIADFYLDSKRLFPLGIIINELLTNIMKYAFINCDTGLIKISLENVTNHVKLTIQDNGCGLPDGFDIDKSKGFGLTLVKMLTQQLAGSFAIENRTGTRCIFEFNV